VIPVALTIARIVMAPACAGLILWAASWVYADHYLAGFIYAGAALVFIVASLTDWLDGYLARKLDAVTPLGAALDHCADKVLITCALVALAYAALPMHLVVAAVIILGRDIAVAGLREGLSASGRALPVSQLGKWKAAAEMAGVATFIAFQAAALLVSQINLLQGLQWASEILIWTGAALALLSAAQYVAAAFRRP
jgi:CDP-diacylglycerol--glycerol-3-phosphate 3-phosphatidyltransferase/cardiolipin synthase